MYIAISLSSWASTAIISGLSITPLNWERIISISLFVRIWVINAELLYLNLQSRRWMARMKFYCMLSGKQLGHDSVQSDVDGEYTSGPQRTETRAQLRTTYAQPLSVRFFYSVTLRLKSHGDRNDIFRIANVSLGPQYHVVLISFG